MKKNGKIIKILANFYYVKDAENHIWECFARNRLLKEGKYLLVGDNVEIELSNSTQGVIVNVEKQKNRIPKPPVANIDQVIIVFSCTEPEIDLYNVDRYISFLKTELGSLKFIVCENKIDLKKTNLNNIYSKAGVEICYVSALTKEGLDEFLLKLLDTTSVLAGPSGVGKSSLIKALSPEADVKIGDLSAINRGKQITRNVQLIDVSSNHKMGYLVDTPGFTQFSFAGMKSDDIFKTFDEFKEIECNFLNCLHSGEEGCKIKEKIKSGEISSSRYESYLKMLEEATNEEVKYETKKESKTKIIAGKIGSNTKIIPKIKEESREKSRKREKQDLQKYQDIEE